jgi:hypothetical protein
VRDVPLALLSCLLIGCGGADGAGDDQGDAATHGDAIDANGNDAVGDTIAPIDVAAETPKSDAPRDTPTDTSVPCPTTPWATSYTLVPTVGAVSDRPAATHPDINVKIRGFGPTGGTLGLVDVGGPTDTMAPKLYTLLIDSGTPTFAANFAVNGWDWATMKSTGPITDPPVTMTAYATTPGRDVRLPKSDYRIAPGLGARVLFLDDDSITLKYTGEDNVVSGYTIHVLDLCIEPKLRAVYDDANAKGRASLPGLAPLQIFAKARTDRVRIVIRDTGSFMDPRVRKDWYQP